MNILDSVISVPFNLKMAQLVAMLDQPNNKDAIDSELAVIGMPGVLSFIMENGKYPRSYVGQTPDCTIVIAHCCENAVQAQELWMEYPLNTTTVLTYSHNDWLIGWAQAISAFMGRQRFVRADRMLFVGHSAGGAMAFVLAKAFEDTPLPSLTRVVTFGSPKPGNRDLARGFEHGTVARWLNDGDPVPDIPPPMSGLSLWGGIITAAQIVRLAGFVQPGGGRWLSPTGETGPTINPRIAPQNWLPDLGAFIWGFINGRGSAHSIDEYVRRLALLNASFAPAATGESVGGDYGGTPPVAMAQAVVLERRLEQVIFSRAVGRAEADIRIPQERQFTIRRRGLIWSVYWQGNIVSVGPTKKRARAFARFGNEFLRRMQAEGQVDLDGMTTAFNAYLSAASDPLGGFQPPLNVIIPLQ